MMPTHIIGLTGIIIIFPYCLTSLNPQSPVLINKSCRFHLKHDLKYSTQKYWIFFTFQTLSLYRFPCMAKVSALLFLSSDFGLMKWNDNNKTPFRTAFRETGFLMHGYTFAAVLLFDLLPVFL